MAEIAISISADTPDAPALAWLVAFKAQPLEALDRLLLGQVWLGGYESLEVAQALPQFLPTRLEETLDDALLAWVSREIGRTEQPESVTPKQYAQALASAFGLMQTVATPRALRWCREHVLTVWNALHGLPSFPSKDARAGLLRALTLQQPNRDLLGFWMSLCRSGQKGWSQLALFGLRRMPRDNQGTPESSLPPALIHGLLDYGQMLARNGDLKKREWLIEFDFLSAVYPAPRDVWVRRLRDALSARNQELIQPVRNWVDERFPSANQSVPLIYKSHKPLETPRWDDEVAPLLIQYESNNSHVVALLKLIVRQHIKYAEAVGDSYFLVRTYCRLADFLLKSPKEVGDPRDPAWALELGQIAIHWEPSNSMAWSVVARALDALSDWTRARVVFWYCRRRFPQNEKAHAQLGHALLLRGHLQEGEAVYRAASKRFPDDPVCHAGLGNALRHAGKFSEAREIYTKARQLFPRDASICNALTGVLIDLGMVSKAAEALEWAQQVCLDDDRSRHTVDDLRRRLHALEVGQKSPPKRMKLRAETATGSFAALESAAGVSLCGVPALGEAALWREAGQVARARQCLDNAPRDARRELEEGWLQAAGTDWAAAAAYWSERSRRWPGDGVLAAGLQLARHRAADPAARWDTLRPWYDELAPLIRLEQDAQARLPAELQGEELSADAGLARWLYDTVQGYPEVFRRAEEDFLAARHIATF